MNNTILHICQVCFLGGVPLFIRDFARAFPEFRHIMNFLHDWKVNYQAQELLRSEGVQVCWSKPVTRQLLEEVNPCCLILHNTPGDLIEGEWPFEWLSKWPTITVHHMSSRPLIPVDLDVFISQEIWNRGYDACEPRIKQKRFCPPGIDTKPYEAIERRPNMVRCVIGKLNTDSPKRHPPDMLNLYRHIQDITARCIAFTLVGGAKHYADDGGNTWDRVPPGGTCPAKNCTLLSKHHKPFAGLHHVWMPPVGFRLPESMYRSYDIFVLRSIHAVTDTWSRVVTEAMASGLPVVADDRGGPKEQIEHGVDGFLCKTDTEFVEHITRLVSHPTLRYEMGMAARKKAVERFGLPNIRATYEKFLLGCLAREK